MNTSATGIDAYLACPRFALLRRTLIRQSEPAPLTIGTAMHGALEWGARAIMAGNVPSSDAVAVEYEKLVRSVDNVDWGNKTRGQAIWEGHQSTMAAWTVVKQLMPADVEREFELPTIGDSVLRGRIDLITADGVRWDFKSASEKARWTANKATEERQPGVYGAEMYHTEGVFDGSFRFLVATKSKAPDVKQFEVPITAVRVMMSMVVAKLVQRAMNAGIFPPAGERCSGCPGNCED